MRRPDGGLEPISANVLLNGQNRGNTPQVISVGPGEYEVSVSKFGYVSEPETDVIRVEPFFKEHEYRAVFSLKEEPPQP
jgi:hypothetical protein